MLASVAYSYVAVKHMIPNSQHLNCALLSEASLYILFAINLPLPVIIYERMVQTSFSLLSILLLFVLFWMSVGPHVTNSSRISV